MPLSSMYLPFVVTLAVLFLSACKGNSLPEPKPSLVSPLNDTGIQFCRALDGAEMDCTLAPPQDGKTGRDLAASHGQLVKTGGGQAGFDWSKLAGNGALLVDQTQAWQTTGSEQANTQWRCVQDHHTGLLWEVKSDVANAINYRNLRYTWFFADASHNGGHAGYASSDDCNGVACNTAAYIEAINKDALCGRTTWRLPTVNELLSIAVSANLDYAIDTHYFPNAKNDQYWSRQSYAPDNLKAWYVYFSDGFALKTLNTYMRLVSGDEQ